MEVASELTGAMGSERDGESAISLQKTLDLHSTLPAWPSFRSTLHPASSHSLLPSSLSSPIKQVDVATALATIPAVMIWDDHDIFDGWGSYDPDMQNCVIFKVPCSCS